MSAMAGDPGEAARLARLTNGTMEELGKDFAFFNHGLVVTRLANTLDPLLEYLKHTPGAMVVPLAYANPVFRGIGTDADGLDFDRHLFVTERSRIEDLARFMLSITAFDPNRRMVVRVCSRVIHVVDQVALNRHAILPATIPVGVVHVFELAGSGGGLAFSPACAGPYDVASVVPTGPDPTSLALLTTLAADHDPRRQLMQDSTIARLGTIGGIAEPRR